jgi:hypothetical protein
VAKVVHARRKVCRDDCFEQGGLPSHELLAKADLTKPADLILNVRLQDAKNLFMPPGSFSRSKGQIMFDDIHCLLFEGTIRFPMLSQDPVKFLGYKIGQIGAKLVCPWRAHPLDKIEYEDAWNQP